MRYEGEPLFRELDLRSAVENRTREILTEIDDIDEDSFLNRSMDDLCDYLEQKYKIDVPRLIDSGMTASHEDTKVDTSGSSRNIVSSDGPAYIRGTRVVVTIPFEGDGELFRYRASTYSYNPPHGWVQQGEVVLTYVLTAHDEKALQSAIKDDIAKIKKGLDWIANDASQFNATILSTARRHMEARRQKLLKDRGLMASEDLRNHFLVQLNGQYEGQATGETFNFEGKTDILIRWEGRNVFLAECKFWDGPESLRKAIDQILSYAAWRDTRTALLLFNRNKDFSAVLAKIPDVVKAHPNYKRELPCQSETGFRCILHHRDDTNRELVLTVLAFDVPR